VFLKSRDIQEIKVALRYWNSLKLWCIEDEHTPRIPATTGDCSD
jgi:hypothetical protein